VCGYGFGLSYYIHEDFMYRWPDYLLVVAERGEEAGWSVGELCLCTTKHFLSISKTWIVIEAMHVLQI
jgi:hypothetical protein